MGWKYLDISLLRQIDLFSNLSEDALIEILHVMKTVEYRYGQEIFKEGDESNTLYLILEGEVRISKNILGVGEEALAILPAGSYFGEMSLIEDRIARSADAISNDKCLLATLTRDDFLLLLGKDKTMAIEILWGFLRTMSRRLRDSNDRVAFFAMSNMFE